MLVSRSPIHVLQHQLSAFGDCLPGIREGRADAIHDARVATRRIREALRVSKDLTRGAMGDIDTAIRRAARALGEARDPDVIAELLESMAARMPVALPAIARLQHATTRTRQDARRSLIKQLERLDIDAFRRGLHALERRGHFTLGVAQPAWREPLREHMIRRARNVRARLERTGGIYFPNRSHSLRLAIKKLRYALELARATTGWRVRRGIRRLRSAQDLLGQVRDHHVVLQRLEAIAPDFGGANSATIAPATAYLEAEIQALHERYLGMRPDIVSVCDECEHFPRSRRLVTTLAAAGVALPLFVLARRPSSTSGQTPGKERFRVSARAS